MEVLSTSPFLSVVYDVITNSESEYLQTVAKSKLVRSEVALSETGSKLSKDRISKQIWLKDNNDSMALRLSKRVELVTGLDLTYTKIIDTHRGRLWSKSSDSWQVVNYGMGGFYDVHHDFLLNPHMYPHLLAQNTNEFNGDRIATFMVYLNDVFAGGNTIFPRLNISVTPVKNAAVFWYNAAPSGEYDELTLHGGCPVLLGEKWVANKWPREFYNAFTRKCGLGFDSLQHV